jgi:hypothetical protein
MSDVVVKEVAGAVGTAGRGACHQMDHLRRIVEKFKTNRLSANSATSRSQVIGSYSPLLNKMDKITV